MSSAFSVPLSRKDYHEVSRIDCRELVNYFLLRLILLNSTFHRLLTVRVSDRVNVVEDVLTDLHRHQEFINSAQSSSLESENLAFRIHSVYDSPLPQKHFVGVKNKLPRLRIASRDAEGFHPHSSKLPGCIDR